MFIDSARIYVKAGNGGDGIVAFHREKYRPRGGPSGGDGGKGGDVILFTDPQKHTLLDFRYKRKFVAKNGFPGEGSRKSGKNGELLIIPVPPGTVVFDSDSCEVLHDLQTANESTVLARGGKGGKGNQHFATPSNQVPKKATLGKTGEELNVSLELKVLADVGLVGFPNAGKSTLISRLSAARPEIADYPFTTKVPNLGIVSAGDLKSFVMADIPGLIEGAHLGKGLGHQFLKHIERTRVLLYLIDVNTDDIQRDFLTLKNELKQFNPDLMRKKEALAITKMDTIFEFDETFLNFPECPEHFLISAVQGQELERLKFRLFEIISTVE